MLAGGWLNAVPIAIDFTRPRAASSRNGAYSAITTSGRIASNSWRQPPIIAATIASSSIPRRARMSAMPVVAAPPKRDPVNSRRGVSGACHTGDPPASATLNASIRWTAKLTS